jgi:hypothetical protein
MLPNHTISLEYWCLVYYLSLGLRYRLIASIRGHHMHTCQVFSYVYYTCYILKKPSRPHFYLENGHSLIIDLLALDWIGKG